METIKDLKKHMVPIYIIVNGAGSKKSSVALPSVAYLEDELKEKTIENCKVLMKLLKNPLLKNQNEKHYFQGRLDLLMEFFDLVIDDIKEADKDGRR